MKNLTILLALALAFLSGFAVGRHSVHTCPSEPPKAKTDTLYIRDTLTVSQPVSVWRRVVDSVLVPVTDTLRLRDTLFLPMERGQVIWRDSLATVYASGILPQVDSVRHYTADRIVIREIPVTRRTRWGMGVQVGYGVQTGGQWRTSPYIGVGVSYNLLSW